MSSLNDPPYGWRFVLSVVLIAVSVQPLHAQTWSVKQTKTFLEESIPTVNGTVVSVRKDGVYVDLKQSGSLPSLPVNIVRKVVSVSGGEQSLRERVIGRGTLGQKQGELAVLSVSPNVKSRVQTGDRVRSAGFRLFVQDLTNSVTSAWSAPLRQLPAVEDVQSGTPPASSPRALALRLTKNKLVLKKAGEWGSLATRTHSDYTNTPKNDRRDSPSGPSLERVDRVKAVVHDFNIVSLPDYPRVQLVVLGAENKVGFGRWKGKVTSLSWHSVNGTVLRVIPLADRMDGLDSFPFLLVKKQDGVISTLYYEFDLTNRKMVRQWAYDDTWIDRVNNRLYAWQIGLNEPFKDRGYPVNVTEDSWDWVESDLPKIPRLSVPSAVEMEPPGIFRLNKSGHLDVFRHGEKAFTSSQIFGGHPVSISARRSKISTSRHPSFLSWKTPGGQTRLLIGNNQTKGESYFKNLQTYKQSRLYLLTPRRDYLNTLWESQRLPGYVSGVFPGESPWVVTVNPTSEESTIHRINNVNFGSK